MVCLGAKQKFNKWINIIAYGCVCCYFAFWVLPLVTVTIIPHQTEERHMWEALPHWFGARQDIPNKGQYIYELPTPPNNRVLDLMWHWSLPETQGKSGDIMGWLSLGLIVIKVLSEAAVEGHSIPRMG
jgi:hypothetical protein